MDTNAYVKRTRCSFNFNYYVLLVFLLLLAAVNAISYPIQMNSAKLLWK